MDEHTLEEQLVAERAARRFAEVAQRKLGYLLRASNELEQGNAEPRELLRRLSHLLIPDLADVAIIHEPTPEGLLHEVEVVRLDPARTGPGGWAPTLADPVGPGAVARTGTPELVSEIPLALQEHQPMVREVGAQSYMILPLREPGGVSAVVSLFSVQSGRRFGPDDLALAEDLVSRAAALVSARRALAVAQGAQRQAEGAYRARQHTVAVVSHDLRNPLAAVSMAAQVIASALQSGDWSRAERATAALLRQTRTMTRLVDDLLDQAAVEEGRIVVHKEVVSAESLIADAIEAIRGGAAARGVELEMDVAQELRMPCDRDRILQVLANLLGNALKFTPDGGWIRVSARREAHLTVISVTDSGPGVPAEARERLFERYYQASSGATQEGVGLGLWIAHVIVEAHGGRIWIEQTPGAGATFSFELPDEPAMD